MNQILAALLLAMIPLWSTAGSPPESVDQYEKIITLSPINNSSIAYWEIGDRWYVSATFTCVAGELFGFWPTEPTCEGDLRIGRENSKDIDIFLQEYLERKYDPLGKFSPVIAFSVNGKRGSSEELFNYLLKEKQPIVAINDVKYKLDEFHKLANSAQVQLPNIKHAEIFKERTKIGFYLLLALAGIGASILILKRIIRYFLKKLPYLIEKVGKIFKGTIGKAIDETRVNQVRRIVIDETIRQTTRSNLAVVSQAEKTALRVQIKNAIDSDNKELANNLMSILQKLEGD